MIRSINWWVIGTVVFGALAWIVMLVMTGVVARFMKYFFCVGYGC